MTKARLIFTSLLFFAGTQCLLAQNFPKDKSTGKITYTDLIGFDSVDAKVSFKNLLAFFQNEKFNRYEDIWTNDSLLVIRATLLFDVDLSFSEKFGQLKCVLKFRCYPNKVWYYFTDFEHIPLENYPPCHTTLEIIEPKCFEGKPFEKKWQKVKEDLIAAMNDYIMNLALNVIPKDQPCKKIIKMSDYFLWRIIMK